VLRNVFSVSYISIHQVRTLKSLPYKPDTHKPSQATYLPPMPFFSHLYDALVKTLQSVLPENRPTIWGAIAEEIPKLETTSELLSEVKNLAGQAASVDEAFGCVRSGLKMLDEQNLKEKDGTPIPKFHSRWVGFQKASL